MKPFTVFTAYTVFPLPADLGDGQVVRWCWVNFQCQGVLPSNLYIEGHGPTVLAVGAGWGGLDIFTLVCHFSYVSPSLGDGPI